jgi:hypothetical protein
MRMKIWKKKPLGSYPEAKPQRPRKEKEKNFFYLG